jgi:hypothetical protein
MIFSWTEWNIEHIARHGVTPEEAEQIVRGARPPFPREAGGDKFLVWGQTNEGRFLQVVFVRPEDEEIDPESLDLSELIDYSEGSADVVYVIHAMELDENKKRRYRQLRRGS